ncbi:RagB/SusD family nutrient uptake outer membrane protein [Carboxylicivirga mesophila]|uniref:RagB/SusD family nutrient uptake outer membrane protein n=1 Tax=Carboxylicivirga mesophila TaxID=1166478 RepID=A0ABS5K645_9BACT|nr:RagB/SusD family nutrient uptake outer membrane protein [Carboxylicivirga mesophila]MBS2210445.1 RagB/SusD family nutrient uptake outer membrane protein [Carboxylicivirga mesophila]
MKNKILIVFAALILVLPSCEDWMDVQPKSEVDQIELFQSEEGYFDALNGVYLMLGDANLYGDKLTMSFMDVLAQNYFIPTGHNYIDLVFHNYETEFGEGAIAGIWNKAYNTIANCNNIIEHLKADDASKFGSNNRNYILGESLAIRAMLHFDLLRLFNAPFLSNPEFIGIPYVDEFKIEVTEQSATSEALSFVVKDLKEAYELLKDDEVKNLTEAAGTYRENRLNYYAVAGLLARVYLYQQDYTNAAIYADEVIASERFQWINPSAILGDKDYVFYPELMMGLYDTRVGETSRNYFVHVDGTQPNELICSDRSATWYEGDDIRFKNWFEVVSTMDGDKRFMKKFNRPKEEEQAQYYQDPVLPLVKLSEMYLILAECKAKNSLPEGIQILNQMKTERRTSLLDEAIDEATFMTELSKEYEREFYGEGQLFFYYKRMNMSIIIGADGSNMAMDDARYTLPLPADEVQFGGRVTN